MSDYEVTLVNDNLQALRSNELVMKGSVQNNELNDRVLCQIPRTERQYDRNAYPQSIAPFAGGTWKIHVELPDQYPVSNNQLT